MKTVIFEVNSEEIIGARFIRAWETGIADTTARYSFATPALMSNTLTEDRCALLSALCGAGAITVEEVARRAQRDCHAVRRELNAMVNAGIIDRRTSGRVIFPYDTFKINFLSHAA